MLKWIGAISEKEIAKCQVYKNAQKHEIRSAKSLRDLNLKSIPFALFGVVIMFLALILKNYYAGKFTIFGPLVLIGVLIGFLLFFVHELLHAIVYPKDAKKYLGITTKPFMFVLLVAYPLKRGRFILMCLIPYVLGILPLVLFLLSPCENLVLNAILWGVAFAGLVSPAIDAYNAWQVFRQVPPGKKVVFSEDGMYFF